MNRLYRNLITLLEQKISIYEEFIALLRREWDALTQYSQAALQETLKKKETLALKMQVLEEQRENLIGEIAAILKKPAAEVTLKYLVESGNASDPAIKRLAACRERLVRQIQIVKEQNDSNGAIINSASLSLKRSLAFIHSVDEGQLASYQSGGRMQEAALQGRLLSMDA